MKRLAAIIAAAVLLLTPAPAFAATDPEPDTERPTAPGNLTATLGPGGIHLSWDASTDNVGLLYYRIYSTECSWNWPRFHRGTTTDTTFAFFGYASSAQPCVYGITVQAYDAAMNSAYADIWVTVPQAPPPFPPPGWPTTAHSRA